MSRRTAQDTVEYLNDAAEYAGLDLEFDYSDEDQYTFVLIFGDSRKKVNTGLMYGYARGIPDRATVKDFAEAISNSGVEEE
jgi:hypothetical protein